jgi:iron complex transport system ATP-binding protein
MPPAPPENRSDAETDPRGAVLGCDGVSFAYGRSARVLDGVSLGLRPGRVCALVGPNGSGKSTLLRVLAGLADADAGEVMLDGRPVRGFSPPARARRLALVPQRPEVAFGYTVEAVVRFGLVARGQGTRAEAAVRTALERVGLAARARDRFEHLSVGQQQRAALARALAQMDGVEKGALLADEPVSAMDPKHAIACLSILRSLARAGHAVLVVLHDLNQAKRFADEAAVLGGDGRLAAHGPVERVLTAGVLEGVFGVGFVVVGADDPGGGVLVPTEPSRG